MLNLDQLKFARALAEIRRNNEHARVLITLNSLTFAYWRQEFLDVERRDRRIMYVIDPRVPSGTIAASCVLDGTQGEEHFYDLRQTQAAGR